MLIAVALALCTPRTVENLNIPWNDAWTTSMKLLSQVYTAKVSAEVILLKPHNSYQKLLYKEIINDIKMSKKYQNVAKIYEVQNQQVKASLYYLSSFYFSYKALKLIQMFKTNSLTDYEEKIVKLGEVFSSLTFSSFKLAVLGKGCPNTTKAVYAYLYKVFKDTSFQINATINSLPGYFTENLARTTIDVVDKLAKALTYQMAEHYLSQSGCKKDSPLPPYRARCPQGMAPPFPWTYKVCYLVSHPSDNGMPSSLCPRFYLYLAYLIEDNNMLKIVCSMR